MEGILQRYTEACASANVEPLEILVKGLQVRERPRFQTERCRRGRIPRMTPSSAAHSASPAALRRVMRFTFPTPRGRALRP